MRDQPVDRADEIGAVNPGDVLTTISHSSAEPMSDQAEQNVKNASTLGTQDQGGSQDHFARKRRGGRLVESPFPSLRHVDAETPRFRDAFFVTAKKARRFVMRGVVTMRIDRRCACLQPQTWRTLRSRDGQPDRFRGIHARPRDLLTIFGGVTTVDALAGEIDYDIGAFQLRGPISQRSRIPKD